MSGRDRHIEDHRRTVPRRVGRAQGAIVALAMAGLWLASVSTPAIAQWRAVSERPAGADPKLFIAVIENVAGYALHVFRDSNDTIRAIFALREGFGSLAQSSCPTYVIDHETPQVARFESERCRLDARRAHFSLGRVDRHEVRSNGLLMLMNGSRLLFRFHLTGLGYQEALFTLRGSKQALNLAIGTEVAVVPE